MTGDLRARVRDLASEGPATEPDDDIRTLGDRARLRLAETLHSTFFQPVPEPFRHLVREFLELAPESATRSVWLQDLPDGRLIALLIDPARGPDLWRAPENPSFRERRRNRRANLAAARLAERSARAPAYWLARRTVTYLPGSWVGTVAEDTGAFYVLAHESLLWAGDVTLPGREPTHEELVEVFAGFLHLHGVAG